MEKYVSSLDASSNLLPIYEQELQLSTSTSQSNNNNQKDREYVTCHMCAIVVPRRFINEHYESDKHNINTKIADVALQRVQKLLHNNIVNDIDKTDSLYFCPECVISLNLKDRQSHEKTVVHKKAVTVDKFLYDFYVLYANQDEIPDLERECEATVAVKSNDVEQIDEISSISPTIEKSQLMNVSEQIEVKTERECEGTVAVKSNDVQQIDDIDNISRTVEKSQLMNVSEQINVKTNDSGPNNTENVITNPLKNYEMNNSNVIKVDKKTNIPTTSKVNNTSLFNVSQFCTVGSNKSHIFCKTCKVYIPNNSGNIASHQIGFKHKDILRKVMNSNDHS